MKKEILLSELEEYEIHHRVFSFITIIVLTIVLIRLVVQIYNPNPTLLDFEIHHFDYGILLLLMTSLLLLFGKKRYSLYLLLSAISFGLILDDIWFIRSNIFEPGLEEVSIYNTTLPMATIFVIAIILVTCLINYLKETKKDIGGRKKI